MAEALRRMPERTSSSVTPKLVVSKPLEDVARSPKPRTNHKEPAKSSPEWIDIDESPPRRRRRRQASSRRISGKTNDGQTGARSSEAHSIRFLPRLGRISEVSESISTSRPSPKASEQRRRRDRSSTKRNRTRDETSHCRPARHRTGGIQQRRSESLLKVNPSLLSVLSSLTGTSDRSSGSSSTVTQQSYNRRSAQATGSASRKFRRADSETRTNMAQRPPSQPNVFDYMDSPAFDDARDGRSAASSSSSNYEPSEAGSSVASDTPSSHSTFPSPTTTRDQSVADLRKKFDAQYGASVSTAGSDSNSPASSIRNLRRRPTVSDVPEDYEEMSRQPALPSELSYNPPRSSSASSRGSRRSSTRIQQQEESMRQHLANTQQGHYVDPAYSQYRPPSTASAHCDRSTPAAPYVALQQYQWASPPTQRPTAPDAPDLSRKTLTGYEELAVELASRECPIKPLYRKFEYLNHRILLHLQDELSEMEEQLRTLDEIIAQMDPSGQRTPASRRAEAFHGSEIHLRRTHLLGNIFVKTEQYNKAMASFASMARDSTTPASEDQISAYRQFMASRSPIHEMETRFLLREHDLIVPGGQAERHPSKHAALTLLLATLTLPLLLFSLIPTLAGRFVATALIAAGGSVVVVTTHTRLLLLLPAREWAVCGAVFVLLMSAVAGCIPRYGS